jgi:hypothetical protein
MSLRRTMYSGAWRMSCAALLFCVAFGCSVRSKVDPAQKTPPAMTSPSPRVAKAGPGVQCTPYGEERPRGPRSYRVEDLGRPGVPHLNADERGTITLIRRYVHRKTLRFAFVGGSMIVFDARFGPCWGVAPGYFVLNGFCNEYYEPGENPASTHGIPGPCSGPRRPWKPEDNGLPGDPRAWSR